MKAQWTVVTASGRQIRRLTESPSLVCGNIINRYAERTFRAFITTTRCRHQHKASAFVAAPRNLPLLGNLRARLVGQSYTSKRDYSIAKSSGLLEQHEKAVEKISTSVRSYYSWKEKFRIYHGSTNSTRSSAAKKNLVDTSSLSNVLSIDKEAMTCLVEPNVPMDRLVEATLRHGLVPPVVMEFPGITVGGGYSGTSGESSSFRHGFFDKQINWTELVLANGEVVRVSPSEKADLFHGAAGAVGTFGVATLFELKLQQAKNYVETTYHPISKGMPEAIERLQQATDDPTLDYIDGIMFSKTQGAIITGRLTNELAEGTPVQRFSASKDPWFYLHVQDAITKSSHPTIEAIPLAEYLFRYDRGGFWVGASAFSYFKFPFNRFTRWWLDDFLHTRMMYTALHASGQAKQYIVQDLALPYSTAEKFVDYTDKEFGIYPLWLCPLKQSPYPTMHPHCPETEADGKTLKNMLNVGLWGFGPKKHDDFLRKNKDLEHKLKELGGMKWLYAHTYYTEDEFWQQFDRKWYEDLRTKYDARTLPSVYEKVKVDVEAEERAEKEKSWLNKLAMMWPLGGFYGIKKAIESGTYIAARKSAWKLTGKSEQ